jgi:hypothetical protein
MHSTEELKMQMHTKSYKAEDVFTSLGYPNPMATARQQARMILLGRLAW